MFDTLISSMWMFAAAYGVYLIATKVLRRAKGFGILVVILHVFWIILAASAAMQLYDKMFGTRTPSAPTTPSAPASAPTYELPGANQGAHPSTPAQPANNPYAK